MNEALVVLSLKGKKLIFFFTFHHSFFHFLSEYLTYLLFLAHPRAGARRVSPQTRRYPDKSDFSFEINNLARSEDIFSGRLSDNPNDRRG